MLEERGRVVAIEPDAIWVETTQRGGCSGCSSQGSCGTGLLSGYFSSASRIRVALNSWDPDDIALHDTVVIGIGENALASGALLVYLLPLISLVLAALGGQALAGEFGAMAGALIGLLGGAAVVRLHSRRHAADPTYAPVLLHLETSR
ncbi:SoxR reducing system RseC family protein [Microbulbifer thermotolerans]|uniref:SoxR reducing system RseC family protein n=1 Tax=Microbulbifer thermotolerans TaxID=252514 RepID=UPI000AD4681E|nr:SoxR reducing system RseC family protein [Microbulbifer thermotolerans]MCX2793638.1 SoxR reducing system RseC family protein [Microbulbifer thermotolerans]MCX2834810.1 SoxR reducing system RseC family protein [Microbulbifer thermotolerans]